MVTGRILLLQRLLLAGRALRILIATA